MARIRSLKPEFFDDEALAGTSPHARLAFAGLWVQADRAGRLRDEPGRLRVRLFPYEPELDMNGLLEELRVIGNIVRYQSDGVSYISIPKFLEHQRPHPKEPDSSIPAPSRDQITASRERPRQNTAQPEPAESREEIRPVVNRRDLIVMRSVDPDPGTDQGREGNRPTLLTAPLIRPRAPWAVWEGVRLQVPQKWHDDHMRALGGSHPDERLTAWYRELDAELQQTGRPVGNPFRWLDRRYERWVGETVDDHSEAEHSRAIAESAARRQSVREPA